jgi:hyperosmotically inducible periplasmic protein
MRVWTLGLIAGAALCLGCEPVNSDRAVPVPGTTPPADATTTTTTTSTNPVAPNNTAVNKRDADGATKTPLDQNENKADIDRTAEIRKRILDTPDMSTNAQNCKVMTANGKVTLRGPVNSEAERETIVKIATAVAGEGNVDNQLEVKAVSP